MGLRYYDDCDYDPEDDAPSGWCAQCNEPCTAIQVDMGIGAYEYWGAPGNHVDYQWVSPCCEADVLPHPQSTPSE